MYRTQMEAARNGIITKQMKIVAEYEYKKLEEIRDFVAKGQVIISAEDKKSIADALLVYQLLK